VTICLVADKLVLKNRCHASIWCVESTMEKDAIAIKDELESYEGYIAYFDILGYQSFLDAHNTPEQATKDVLRAILNVEKDVPQQLAEFLDRPVPNEVKKMQWHIFSDTIMITAPFEDESSEEDRFRNLIVLLAVSSQLMRYMFDFGLPLRGAITQGSYVLAKTCFAGLPIINAYRICSTLDASVCVVEEGIIHQVQDSKIDETNSLVEENHITRYLVPLNNGKEKLYSVLIPSIRQHSSRPTWGNIDVKQLVAESFMKHGKLIGTAAISKLTNTELFLRFVKMKLGKSFQ